MHQFALHNGVIHEAGDRLLSSGQVGLLNGWGVFSTIRVFDGVLFAFERHWERMRTDAEKMHVPFPGDPAELREMLLRLVEANHAFNSTLRVAIVRNQGGAWEGPGIDRPFDVIAFTTVLSHWDDEVKLAVQKQARHSGCPFTGTKILSWSYNLVWLEQAKARGFDEVILLNERDEVAECTSANIFATIGGQVLTPPLNSGCLPGITRQVLLSESLATPYPIVEKTLTLEDLMRAEAVFITSTTRELLAVSCIEEHGVSTSHGSRLVLQKSFSNHVDTYVGTMRRQGICARLPITLR
jgi:branched-chain amino acid aminotransferase